MIPSYYEFYNPVKIISGQNAMDNLPYEIGQLGASRPIIVTDPGVSKAGLIDVVKQAFDSSDVIIGAIYDAVPPDSSIDTVNEIVAVYRQNNCDCFVAVGGGSAIDTAKGANIVVSENSDDLMKFVGADVIKGPLRPLVVVPTTSGTGSEVTLVAVVANPAESVKMSFTSYHLLPKLAVLDPRMVMTMPPHITAATGMDALTHAMEGYVGLQKNPMSDAYAMAAIKLISQNLVKAVKNGKDEKARMAMSNAATMAGASFSNSMVGIVHAMGHALGGICHVPHGLAMSIFLPYGMEYNLEKIGPYLAEMLLPLGGIEEYVNTPDPDKALRTIALIRKLQRELSDACGLPMSLKAAGVSRDSFRAVAKAAINDGSLTFNPIEVEFEDAMTILEKAY